MIISDLISVLYWWLIFFILGLVFLPLTNSIFKSFFDKGYAFSKILGLLLVSYSVWLLASLKILPFNFFSIILVLAFFLALNLKFLKSFKLLRIYFLEEGLFLIGLIFWAFIKAHEPSIHGLEKFMDFGFINSTLRSDFFPPKDMWLTPETINYYYFGHFTSALLIKFTNVLPEIGYNLTLASLFGLCLSASFSVGANLYFLFLSHKPQATSHKLLAISGFLSAFLVTLGGNLQTIYIFFQSYKTENPVPFWLLPLVFNPDGYWYPNATRFIPFTIHEFPLYSFVVSDLHGHVFNIPFVLLLVALLIEFFHSSQLNAKRYTLYALFALLIAVFLMTNVLDGPIYLLVIFIVFLIRKISFPSIPLTTLISQITLIILGAIIFSLPFWLNFKPFASGIGVLCTPTFLTDIGRLGPFLFEADHCTRSPLWMLLILWGFPLFIFFSFLIHLLPSKLKDLSSTFHHLPSSDKLALILSFSAFILILIPEFFYAKDIYPAHYRANTVFKFGYQAFIILGLVSGYMLTRIISSKKLITLIFLIPLIFLISIYPFFAIKSYYGELKNYQGLSGLSYLRDLYPTDYQAILWLRQNISGQPVILEAQGDSYTDFARVSANTGLPTVLGWPVHEWLWRGSYDEPGKRTPEISLLYESPDLKLTQNLLKKYNIKYVFIGALEKQKYLKLDETKFSQLGKVIFESGSTKIYQIN